jgi:hypothetical protein
VHLEILTEDSSTKQLLHHLMPRFIAEPDNRHSWRIHSYTGIGRIPPRMSAATDPRKRILLDQLPRLLRGYAGTPGIDAVIIVLDTDHHNCQAFLAQLQALATSCGASHLALFRLAIEETEAWYLGDRTALLQAYPRAKLRPLDDYKQDSVCGTWELLAESIYDGGMKAIRRVGWPLPGQIKHEWANRIGPLLDPEANHSPSFGKLRDGIRKLVAHTPPV